MTDPQILDAENTLVLYQRFLRDIPTATVPRQWVETLLQQIEILLDKYAELVSQVDPELEFEEDTSIPLDPYEYDDPSLDDFLPEDFEPNEEDNESTTH